MESHPEYSTRNGDIIMIHYKLELKMADHSLKINAELKNMLCNCAKYASNSVLSKRTNRKFWIDEDMPDEYTVIVHITSRDPINPTRSISAITRTISKNPSYYSLIENHIVNGMIFKTRCIEKENETIIQKPDDEIVSEIISIFFGNCMSTQEKELRREYADKIRSLILDYINSKNNS